MSKKSLVLIVHDVRSCHNVGSILRTADGIGVNKVYLTGYTPYPKAPQDKRMPHIYQRLERQINKTALGAQDSVRWVYCEDIFKLLDELKSDGFSIFAIEQAKNSIDMDSVRPADKTALIVGNEVDGLSKDILSLANKVVEIPMNGKKESFNVSVASAIALYEVAKKHKLL